MARALIQGVPMAKARKPRETEQNRPDSSITGNGSAEDRAVNIESAAAAENRTADGYSPDRIAARAYELYLARGASDGRDFDDWLAAERELAKLTGSPLKKEK